MVQLSTDRFDRLCQWLWQCQLKFKTRRDNGLIRYVETSNKASSEKGVTQGPDIRFAEHSLFVRRFKILSSRESSNSTEIGVT
jgi:hypothetical protein